MRDTNEIMNEIKSVKSEINSVEGTECDVYARIVGYYRSVKNFNVGKKSEFKDRVMFDQPNDIALPLAVEESSCPDCMIKLPKPIADLAIDDKVSTNDIKYVFFSQPKCPKCGPFKDHIISSHLDEVTYNDAATESGMNKAVELGVVSTPTMIMYSGNKEIKRFYSVEEFKEFQVESQR